MPRAAQKLQIVELSDGRYCITPVVQQNVKRSREFDTADAAMHHIWHLITTQDEAFYVSFEPNNVVEAPEL